MRPFATVFTFAYAAQALFQSQPQTKRGVSGMSNAFLRSSVHDHYINESQADIWHSGVPGIGPADVYAFSLNNDHYETVIDEDFRDYISSKLDKADLECSAVKEKRGLALDQSLTTRQIDNDLVQCLMSTFRVLVRDAEIITHLWFLNAAAPPGNKWNPNYSEIGAVPRFDLLEAQETFQQGLPLAAVLIPQAVGITANEIVFAIPELTIMLTSISWVYQHGKLLQNSYRMNYRGVMGQACPPVDSNPCGHALCEGTDGECALHSFLKGCKCNQCEFPSDAKVKLFCKESECGGADENGLCKGGKDDKKYKGCDCVQNTGNHKYPMRNGIGSLQKLVSAGKWEPPAPPAPTVDLLCQEGWDQYLHWAQLDKLIPEFCDKVENEYGQGQFFTYDSYNDGTPDHVEIEVSYRIKDLIAKEDVKNHCIEHLRRIGNDCDKDAVFKHGGVLASRIQADQQFEYRVFPQHKRPKPIPAETITSCNVWYKGGYNEVFLYGGLYAGQDYGWDFLYPELSKCGFITEWFFDYFDKPNEENQEWSLYFHIPIGHWKWGCVRDAAIRAGASPNFKCGGH